MAKSGNVEAIWVGEGKLDFERKMVKEAFLCVLKNGVQKSNGFAECFLVNVLAEFRVVLKEKDGLWIRHARSRFDDEIRS